MNHEYTIPALQACDDKPTTQASVGAQGADKHTIYVLVREDLLPSDQVVQACHASAEAGKHFYQASHGIATLVLLGVRDLRSLLKAKEKLVNYEIDSVLFHEPDFDMGFSALATRPVLDVERRHLKSWRLWNPGNESISCTLKGKSAAL